MREYLSERTHLSASTRTQYVQALELGGELLGGPSPSRLILSEMHRMESVMQRSTNTRAIYCSTIRTFLRWSGNRDALRWVISAKQHPKVDGIFLSEEAVQKVRSNAKMMSNDHELLYSLAVDNGCRLIDMERMTVQNGRELLSCHLSMILSKGRGGGKIRPLALNAMTIPSLKQHLEAMDQEGATLFPYRKLQMWRRLREVSESSGVRFTPHDLRRTLGNRLWRKGVDVETIAKILRHEDSGITFRAYIGLDADDMRGAMRKLCPSELGQSEEADERYLSTDLYLDEPSGTYPARP
jgi:integrase